MSLHADVLKDSLELNVKGDKILAHQILVKKVVHAEGMDLTSSVYVHLQEKEKFVNLKEAIFAVEIHVEMEVRVGKVRMAPHSSASADRVTEEISVKQL